jgi:hypothetical protein
VITENELRSMERITPQIASSYIGSKTISAQFIRIWAQNGRCPFCVAENVGGGRRYTYVINREALIKYKRGDMTTEN